MKMNKFLNVLPLLVLGASLNKSLASPHPAVSQELLSGNVANAGRILQLSASDFKTYQPALIATAAIGGYRMLRRFLR